MASSFETVVKDELVLSDGGNISGLALPDFATDHFVFLDAPTSADALVTNGVVNLGAADVTFDDGGSTNISSSIDPFELASTSGAAAADDDHGRTVDSSPVAITSAHFSASGGINSILNVAPMTIAISPSPGAHDSSGLVTASIPTNSIPSIVIPEPTLIFPVITAPVGASPDASAPVNIVVAPGDTANSVLVNGDGEIVSLLSNSTAGSGSGSGTGSGGGNTSSSTASTSPFVINVVYDASVNNAPAAFKTDVTAAVQYFESHFTDHVTITIDVGYGEVGGYSLGSGALGESLTYLSSYSYSQIKGALTADAKTADDATSVASLPTTSPVAGTFWTSTAEAKALGLMASNSQIDGYVGFASGNLFDYNNSDGVTAGQYDFYGTVAHEISEVMGRSLLTGSTIGNTPHSYDPLDLFHYSANGVHDFSGSTAGYFSVNGGATNLDNFNTNPNGDFGDWASSAGSDSFSAFATPGAVDTISQTDLRELDVLGWDLGSSSSSPGTPSPPSAPPPQPDLVVSKFSFAGAHFSYEVDNIGKGAAAASTTGIDLSTSPTGANSLIGAFNTPALSAGGADTELGAITWGSGTTGTYYISVAADYKNTVAESNESNNQSGQIALVIGNSASNTLTATSGTDVIFGMGGKDTLIGGAGADQFVFNTALNASINMATITNFSSAQGDQIDLDHTIFTKLTPEALGAALASSDFYASANGAAHLATDRILYNTTTGALSYDSDGTGAAAAVQFAVVAQHPTLTAHDFMVV
jgi:Ca2+-binding RTX toxin-like protein